MPVKAMQRRQLMRVLVTLLAFGTMGKAYPALAQPLAPDIAPSALFDREGYRRASYRAPVDRAPAPALTLSRNNALHLHPRHDSLFFDVADVETGWRDPSTGIWRISGQHETIAGAQWFPGTGTAQPDPVLWAGLIASITAMRHAHPLWPVVIFCHADCWKSWNVARRLARQNVANIWWFAEGIEGWRAAQGKLKPVLPEVSRPRR